MIIKGIYVFQRINNNHKLCKDFKINLGIYNVFYVVHLTFFIVYKTSLYHHYFVPLGLIYKIFRYRINIKNH